jgi:hypothetical protein
MLSIIPISGSSSKYMMWADYDHEKMKITTLVVTDGSNVWRNSAPLGYSNRPQNRRKEEGTTFMHSLSCAVTFTRTELNFDYSCEEKDVTSCLTLKIRQEIENSSSVRLLLEVDLQRDITSSSSSSSSSTSSYSAMSRLLQQISTTMQQNLTRSQSIVEINTQVRVLMLLLFLPPI